MSPSPVIASADTKNVPIAPWWHTVLVLLPIALGSVASAYQHGLPDAHVPGLNSRLSSYLTVLAEEWGVVFLIWLALRRRGFAMGSPVAGRWHTPGAFFRDFGIGVGFLVVAIPLVGGLTHFLGGNTDLTLANITPKTGLELVVWLVTATTAGFCEELTFRGYLTRQLSAWTGNRAWGVILQGVMFGLAHGYYHEVMVAVMVQGWLLGLLAHWRKNLRPGMLAHGLQDAI